ncbi:hypothetical protein EV702DRAFT_1245948 [Suillus placidus]|uniref:Translation initiation factor beta propellor-like domain-containing protein n=1 Tax=Suillus placidus TaxID=48579 RepID=A0A9P6ZPP8_9AGAM|nr:hypothetical protein EV702DRAFT_1245948 [Suillus placidus]
MSQLTYHYVPRPSLTHALITVVHIFLAEGAQLLQELSVPKSLDSSSPRAEYSSAAGNLDCRIMLTRRDRSMLSRGAQTRIKSALSVDSWINRNIDEDLYHRRLILQAVALQLPHLRVDNGMKVWYCTGGPMHVQLLEELYQALSRPRPLDQAPSFGQAIPATPQPSLSVLVVALPLGLLHPSLQELTDRQVQIDLVAHDVCGRYTP